MIFLLENSKLKIGEKLVIDSAELKKMMDMLSSLFSIRVSFIYEIGYEKYTDEIAGNNGDYQEFCKIIQLEMKEKCIACDQEMFKKAQERDTPLLYKCFNGLYEMFMPLYIENLLVGYLHFGQVRSEEHFASISEACSLYSHTKFDELEKSYNSMNIIPKEKLFLIAELFKEISALIISNKLIKIRHVEPEYYIKKFIEDNYSKTINLSDAAKYVSRSSSFITHKFKKHYGITFHQFIINYRIEKAKEFLKSKSISETFPLCGFKNRYHFSKVFRAVVNQSPREYQIKVWTDL